jgi:hypothetical protein
MQAAIASSMPEHIRRWRTMGGSVNNWSNNVRVMRTFASQRPINCRQHLVTQLRLGGFATVTLNVSHTNRGRLRINTLVIDGNTLGVTNGVAYPWRGAYFRGVPVEIQALPAPGYVFAGWSNRADLGLKDTILVNLSNNVTWTALFERSTPHDLSAGPYLFTAWDADAPAGTYPPHMRFEQTSVRDAGLGVPMENDWPWPYNLTNRSRLNGLGEGGLAFLNTGSTQDGPGAGYLGTAVLSLRTVGVTNIEVSWVGGTITPNQQAYALRLQYAVADADYQDVLEAGGQPVEYAREAVAGHEQILGPVRLPPAANNQPYLSLRWRYYWTAGASGPRSQLRLDDILVKPAGLTTAAAFTGLRVNTRETQMECVGSPHQAYGLEVSTNLTDWIPWKETITDIRGGFGFIETNDLSLPARFYRVRGD